MTDQEYHQFCAYLEDTCGIVLGEGKQYLVRSRLLPMLSSLGFKSLSELIAQIGPFMDRRLRTAIIDAMTTNETLWFRDNYPFTALAQKILPELEGRSDPIRIWSAASSSGQEAYSIAMTLAEARYYRPQSWQRSFEIVGSDVSDEILKKAQAGVYDKLALARGLSLEKKRQFFVPFDDECMQICPDIRKMVHFCSHNLKDSAPFLGQFDVIFCRNVLIYFSPEMKALVLKNLVQRLKPKGFLILGGAESLSGLSDRFKMIRCEPGIIYQLK